MAASSPVSRQVKANRDTFSLLIAKELIMSRHLQLTTLRLSPLTSRLSRPVALGLLLGAYACGSAGPVEPNVVSGTAAEPTPQPVTASAAEPTSASPDPAPESAAGEVALPRTARGTANLALEATGNRYLVTMASPLTESSSEESAAEVARVAGKHRVQPRQVFAHALRGFSASLSDEQLAALRQDPAVTQIEPVRPMSANAVQSMGPDGQPWGLDRIDHRELGLDKRYRYDYDGAGIRAYVIDTGIEDTHPDITGRALRMFDAFNGNGSDENGHGTHVAATIGGTQFGVAKKVLLRGVKVLNKNGKGTNETVLQGIEWVARNAVRPAIVNISIGGERSAILNQAIDSLSAKTGILVVVAAGNEAQDACKTSPASAPSALAVAATTKSDKQASFSNFGACVTMYAPGDLIRSAYLGGSSLILSGTSMASPHVAGTAVLFKAKYGDLPAAALKQKLVEAATAGVVKSVSPGTPNRLLYQGLSKVAP